MLTNNIEEEDGPTAEERAGAGRVVFPRANPHLYRQLVARGCYSAMLEHFYALFPSQQLRVLCTEDLAPDDSNNNEHDRHGHYHHHHNHHHTYSSSSSYDGSIRSNGDSIMSTSTAAATMRSLAAWLGLGGPEVHNFEATVRRGRFNAGENRGYDKLTAWDSRASGPSSSSSGEGATSGSAPVSPRPQMPASLQRKLTAFYAPFNERLFELADTRCSWPGQ